MNHTPGPWRIGTPPPNGQQTIGTRGGLMTAVATTGENMPTIANAHLIAAAPELLEALSAAAEYFQMLETATGIEHDVLRHIRAAIAKAKGES